MIDRTVHDAAAALAGIEDGATLMVSGFGESGVPKRLIEGLIDAGTRDLTVIANNAGSGEDGLAALFRERRVRKVVCSYPRSRGSHWFERRYREGGVELVVMPQGTLSECIRAGGSGIPAFFTPTAVDTALGAGREVREFAGRRFLLEHALTAEAALIKASKADRWGNLVYHHAARNYAPTMAMAAELTVAEVETVVPIGELDPEAIVTPGIFVDRVFWTGVRGAAHGRTDFAPHAS